MIKITKATNSTNGLTVPTNSIIKFRTSIQPNGLDVIFELFVFLSQESYELGDAPISIKEIFKYVLSKQITPTEAQNLSPLVVHQILKTLLEEPENSSLAGNLEIVLA